jgi:hypothetical protein
MEQKVPDEVNEFMEALPGVAQALSRILDEVAGQRVFFTLMVQTPTLDTYVSNTPRDQCIAPIKKLLSILESGHLDVPSDTPVH